MLPTSLTRGGKDAKEGPSTDFRVIYGRLLKASTFTPLSRL